MSQKSRTALAISLGIVLSASAFAQSPRMRIVGGAEPYRHVFTQGQGARPLHAALIEDHIVRLKGRAWLSLEFSGVTLGEGSRLEVESLRDGQKQIFGRNDEVKQTAYFNGDAVRVRLWAGPGTTKNGFTIQRVFANSQQVAGPQTLCGIDNRLPSGDKRVARILVKFKGSSRIHVCTAFLISEWNCFATAGHCLANIETLRAQFNVPLSTATGAIQHPPVKDQYAGPVTFAFQNAGKGKDWGLFTTKKNQQTGLYPGKAQGGFFPLAPTRPTKTLLVTGYGRDKTPAARNHTLQWSPGPLSGLVGTELRYAVDTEPGSSGSPVHGTSSLVYAIHTHGGCGTLGYNSGTWVTNALFIAARKKICVPPREPDLSAVTFADNSGGTFKAGQSYTLTSRIKNVGFAPSPLLISGYYLSDNSTISTADRLLKPFRTKALNPGETHATGENVRMPTDLKPGTCWAGVFADNNGTLAELSETNNTKASAARKCVNNLPDLIVDLFQADKNLVWPGLVVKTTTRICNKGFAAAGPAQHGIFLSDDATISTSDTLLGSFPTAAILPNFCQLVVKNVTMPTRLRIGKCWLGAHADHVKAMTEVSETNNTKSLAVQCGRQPLPDLVITNMTVNTTRWQTGSLYTGHLTLGNIGATADAPPTRTRIVLSPDADISLRDRSLMVLVTPRIAPKSSVQLKFQVRIPNDAKPGICYIGAIADSSQAVVELREDNNTRAVRGTCFVGKPDLVISKFIRTPPVVNAGSVVVATVETRNAGTGPTGAASVTGIYLSGDTTITTNDVFLGSYPVPNLAPLATTSVTKNYQVPFCASGSLHLGAIADAKSAIAESDETNNTASATQVVNRYQGSGKRIEWRGPKLDNMNGPMTTTDARFPKGKAFSAKMCIAAPKDGGKFAICIWSTSAPAFAFDLWSNISLLLANSPILPNWVQLLPPTGFGSAEINMPNPGLPPMTLYTHLAIVGGGFSWGDNVLRMQIMP